MGYALKISTPRHRIVQMAVATLAILASGLVASSPAQAAPDIPAGYQMLPGWELPARVTVQADGSILAEADPAAVEKLTIAAAATACGYTCDGKNPQTYKYSGATCGADAITVKAVYEPGGQQHGAELRYSVHCGTAWTRRSADTEVVSDIWVYSYKADGSYRTSYLVHDGESNFTSMVYDAGSLTAKACFGYNDYSSPPPFPYYKICTTAY